MVQDCVVAITLYLQPGSRERAREMPVFTCFYTWTPPHEMAHPMFRVDLPFLVKSSGNTTAFMPRGVFPWCFLIPSR